MSTTWTSGARRFLKVTGVGRTHNFKCWATDWIKMIKLNHMQSYVKTLSLGLNNSKSYERWSMQKFRCFLHPVLSLDPLIHSPAPWWDDPGDWRDCIDQSCCGAAPGGNFHKFSNSPFLLSWFASSCFSYRAPQINIETRLCTRKCSLWADGLIWKEKLYGSTATGVIYQNNSKHHSIQT